MIRLTAPDPRVARVPTVQPNPYSPLGPERPTRRKILRKALIGVSLMLGIAAVGFLVVVLIIRHYT